MSEKTEKAVKTSVLAAYWAVIGVVALVLLYVFIQLWFAIAVDCPPPSFGKQMFALALIGGAPTAAVLVFHFLLGKRLLAKFQKKATK